MHGGITREEGGTALGDTLQGGDTRMKLKKLWLNLERTLDKLRQKVGVVIS